MSGKKTVLSAFACRNRLRGGGFPTLLRCSRLRTGFANRRFAKGQNLGLNGRSTLDSSDHRPVGRARCGQGYEPVLAPQTINQSAFPRTQHLLWQREKIPERPNQVRALREIRLYVSRTDRCVQRKNTIGEFFNPHVHPTWKRRPTPPLLLKRAIIAPQMGHWEAIFLS